MPASQPKHVPESAHRDWRTVVGSLLGTLLGAHGWLARHSQAALLLLCCAGTVFVLSLLAPSLWAPLGRAVNKLVALLLQGLTWLLLLLLFVGLFIPGRLLLLLLRRDPLDRSLDAGRKSYWEPLAPRQPRHFERQY